jgi:hypothetical protein
MVGRSYGIAYGAGVVHSFGTTELGFLVTPDFTPITCNKMKYDETKSFEKSIWKNSMEKIPPVDSPGRNEQRKAPPAREKRGQGHTKGDCMSRFAAGGS